MNGVVDFAGTDAAYKSTDPQPPKPFLYFPTVVAPITVSYNLEGVKLKLSPETDRQDLLRHDHDLGRRRDQGRQPEGEAARAPTITVVHRCDGSGTTANFTSCLTKAAPTDVDARHRLDRELARGHPGRDRQLRCGQAREGHRRRGRLRRLLRRQGQRPDVRGDQELGRQVHRADAGVGRGRGAKVRRSTPTSPTTRSTRTARRRTRSPRRRGSSCTRPRPTQPRATRSRAS